MMLMANATLALNSAKRTVPKQFNEVAGSYDLLTRLNPGYHTHLCKSAKRLELGPGARVLDLCCGTGASTSAVARVYPDAEITGIDASEGMLGQARLKAKLDGVDFRLGDAMDVRACGVEGEFDGILMAYGIRNVPDADLCLQRIITLLKPAGRVVFHEYSVDDSLWGKAIWNLVCLGVIIPGGLMTSPRSGIYRYLRRSVNDFDGAKAFQERLRTNGFTNVSRKSMGGWQWGIVHSFIAERPG